MQSLKRRMITFFSVILCTVLGALLILGYPASAKATTLPYTLEPNTPYKVYRTPAVPGDPCYGKTAYAKFTFDGRKFPGGKFEETYPIQDGWELYFNTPLTVGQTGSLDEDGSCGLEIEPDLKLQLLSGFKTKDEAEHNLSGHFVIAKDYYSAIPNTMDPSSKEDYDYELLGSLTAIGGDNFPALGGASIGELIIKPNAIRAPHWHLQFAEAGYCYKGIGQVGVIVPAHTIPNSEGFIDKPTVQEMFIKKGEVFLFPEGSQHYLRNIGRTDFACTLFFTEGPPLNGDQLLSITLQNIVGNTPLGVLGPVLVTDSNPGDGPVYVYTAKRISKSPAQTYTSVEQGPDVIEVIETCRGSEPDYYNQGCSSPPLGSPEKAIFRSIYSRLQP